MDVLETLLEAKAHLSVALIQASPTDDKIILSHIKEAESLIAEAVKEIRG